MNVVVKLFNRWKTKKTYILKTKKKHTKKVLSSSDSKYIFKTTVHVHQEKVNTILNFKTLINGELKKKLNQSWCQL